MMKQVCKDVGWDGQGFCCLRCGKAEFKSEASARGHLSQCKGRAISRGVFHPLVETVALPAPLGCCEQVLPAYGGGVPTTLLGGAPGGTGGGQTTSLQSGSATEDPGWYGVDQRLRSLENEYNHLLMQRNLQPAGFNVGDWFSQNKAVIIISVVALMIYVLSRQSECECPNGEVGKKVSKVGGLGQKALSKLTDRAISKSIDSLFK